MIECMPVYYGTGYNAPEAISRISSACLYFVINLAATDRIRTDLIFYYKVCVCVCVCVCIYIYTDADVDCETA